MKLSLYTTSLSIFYSCTRFFSGELSQTEVGFLVFTNVFLFLQTLIGWKGFFFNLRITFLATFFAVAFVSKYNELVSTIRVENEYMMDEIKRQVFLLKERTIIDTQGNNLQDHEQTILTLITLTTNQDFQSVFNLLPKSRPVQHFIENITRVVQQTTNEIQIKRKQVLSPHVLKEHILGNKYILNKYLLKILGFYDEPPSIDVVDSISTINAILLLVYQCIQHKSIVLKLTQL